MSRGGFPLWLLAERENQRRLKRRKVIHFRRKLKQKLRDLQLGHAEPEDVAASVQGWLGHARHGETGSLRRQVLSELPDEVRKLLKS